MLPKNFNSKKLDLSLANKKVDSKKPKRKKKVSEMTQEEKMRTVTPKTEMGGDGRPVLNMDVEDLMIDSQLREMMKASVIYHEEE